MYCTEHLTRCAKSMQNTATAYLVFIFGVFIYHYTVCILIGCEAMTRNGPGFEPPSCVCTRVAGSLCNTVEINVKHDKAVLQQKVRYFFVSISAVK